VSGCVTEPVMPTKNGESANNDEDDECHQMVMAWTLDDWRVNIDCELCFTTEYKS